MDKNNVLLTASESVNLAEKHLEKHKCLDTFGRERDKAQCLKLLDMLKQDCWHGLVGIKVGECSSCMSEIEKLLKEKND